MTLKVEKKTAEVALVVVVMVVVVVVEEMVTVMATTVVMLSERVVRAWRDLKRDRTLLRGTRPTWWISGGSRCPKSMPRLFGKSVRSRTLWQT